VLSNAVDWQFIIVDGMGLLWTSETISINLHSPKEEQNFKVYRFLYFLSKVVLMRVHPIQHLLRH
jgi:hypothetical protein